VYSGDAIYLPSTSTAFTLTVPPRQTLATTTTVGASVNSISGDVRISALVDACAPGGAPAESGTLQFFDGATLVGSVTLSTFGLPPTTPTPCSGGTIVSNGNIPLTLPAVSPGPHTYTAVYSGDAI